MSESVQCGYCRNDIPSSNFGIHEATCMRHHFKCLECDEFVSKSSREEHEHLYHTVQRCEKCGTKYNPINKDSHDSICQFSQVTCSFCDSHVIRKDFRDHRDACGARTEKCEKCGRYVMLKDTTTHICRSIPQQDFTTQIGTMFSSSLPQPLDDIEEMVRRQQELANSNLSNITNPVATHLTPRQYIPPRKILSPTDRDTTEPHHQRATQPSHQRNVPLGKDILQSHQRAVPLERDTHQSHQKVVPLDREIQQSHQRTLPLDRDTQISHQRTLPLDRDTQISHQRVVPLGKDTQISHQRTVPLDRDTLISHQRTLPLDRDTQISHQRTVPLDRDTQISHQRTVPLDRDTQISHQRVVPLGKDTQISHQRTVPLDRDTQISHQRVVPLDRDTQISHQRTLPLDRDTQISHQRVVPLGKDTQISHQKTVPLDRDTHQSHKKELPHKSGLSKEPRQRTQFREPAREPMPPFNISHSPTSDTIITPQTPNFVSLSSLEDRLPKEEDSVEAPFDLDSDLSAPCEFCGNQVPLTALEGHQLNCKHRTYLSGTDTKYCSGCKEMILEINWEHHSKMCRPRTDKIIFDQSIGSHQTRKDKREPEVTPLLSSSLIPCEFCDEMFDFSEIKFHQAICTNRNGIDYKGEDVLIQCVICEQFFEDFEIAEHRNGCVSQQQQQTPITATKFDSKSVKKKCEFCQGEFSFDKLENHLKICYKKPRKPRNKLCQFCLTSFTDSDISDHENTCSYRHFDPRTNTHKTDLPFSTPDLKIERKNSDPINNKCPYCKFPKPALDMENHKNICAKNPRFREKYPAFERTSPEINLAKSLGPELGISTGLAPKFQDNNNNLNPFRSESNSRKLASTERTMDIQSSPVLPSKDYSKYSLYSTRDPSPQQQTTNKQQQYTTNKQHTSVFTTPEPSMFHRRGSQSPTSLFRDINEKKIAFGDINSDREVKFVPITDKFMPPSQDFKCELKTINPHIARENFKKTSPLEKPSHLNFSEKQTTIDKPLLTPTQDTEFMVFEPSAGLGTRYSDTSASYKPQDVTRKNSSGKLKYPRHNSPVTDKNTSSIPDRFYSDKKKEIVYPPGGSNTRDSYPKITSNATETIVDPPVHAIYRKSSNSTFEDRYPTKNRIHRDYN